MNQPQLFDDPTIREPTHEKQSGRKRGTCTPDPVGSGPDGETCGSCIHRTQTESRSGKRFYKCGMMRKYWTHGGATDIKLRWEACRTWKPGVERHMQALRDFNKKFRRDFEPANSTDWRFLASHFADVCEVGHAMACVWFAELLEIGETGG